MTEDERKKLASLCVTYPGPYGIWNAANTQLPREITHGSPSEDTWQEVHLDVNTTYPEDSDWLEAMVTKANAVPVLLAKLEGIRERHNKLIAVVGSIRKEEVDISTPNELKLICYTLDMLTLIDKYITEGTLP